MIGKKYFITQRYCEWYLYQNKRKSSLKLGEVVRVNRIEDSLTYFWGDYCIFSLPDSLLHLLREKL